MRLRKKKNLAPRMERCGDVWVREPELLLGRWLLDRDLTAVHLEIGCGCGKFTVETAAAEPGALLVGIEKVPSALVRSMERAGAMGLSNALFINGDAEKLLEMFGPGEVSRVYLNFSDPWPGRRHEKRRLTSPGFLARYAAILAPGGEVHVKTDNRALFEYSVKQFPACGYTLEQVTTDLHGAGPVGIMTDYEAKFHEMGLAICRCVARLTAPPPAGGTPPLEGKGEHND